MSLRQMTLSPEDLATHAPTGLVPVPTPHSFSLNPSTRPFKLQSGDPHQPLQTIEQQKMAEALENQGVYGLALTINEIAVNSARPDHAQYKLIIDDMAGPKLTYQYLMRLPNVILHALIDGTLPSKFQQDRAFNAEVHKWMQHLDGAGVYMNCIAYLGLATRKWWNRATGFLEDHLPLSQARNWTGLDRGKWMSANLIREYIAGCRLYMVDSNFQAEVHARKNFTAASTFYSNETDHYLRAVERHYLDNCVLLDEPFQRVPLEVGQSVDMKSRLAQHQHLTGTNKLLGFAQVWAQGDEPKGYPIFATKMFQFVVFYCDAHEDMNLCEAVASILCSSYHWHAGLNPKGAGTKADLKLTSRYGPQHHFWKTAQRRTWDINAQLIRKVVGMDKMLVQRKAAWFEEIENLKTRYELLKLVGQENEDAKALDEELKRLIEANKKLEKKLRELYNAHMSEQEKRRDKQESEDMINKITNLMNKGINHRNKKRSLMKLAEMVWRRKTKLEDITDKEDRAWVKMEIEHRLNHLAMIDAMAPLDIQDELPEPEFVPGSGLEAERESEEDTKSDSQTSVVPETQIS
jgi:hypothetical protein